MESSIPAIFPAGTLPENPFSSFEKGFNPWESCELFPSHPQSPKPVSDEPNRSDQNPANSNSCSDELNRTVSDVDERKRRRMISNRESARRSRMRKQTHLENLRNQASRLRIENRDLTNRLRYVLYHTHSVRSENDQLRSEQCMLQQRLSIAGQILIFRQPQQQYTSAWPCNNAITNETPLSLVTS
ncbi:hypothetical protein K2173_014840 [Erythroxylum novogranatense]|uniref:BZIP domain-containing protein n=1 Tax=Erythroxylum novogranatense TaxID=1862640 RepID=A0AAV8TG73_9ROSI|nr:hypothetical protein K2173_014840 [Erythroxylum novogranatense]